MWSLMQVCTHLAQLSNPLITASHPFTKSTSEVTIKNHISEEETKMVA